MSNSEELFRIYSTQAMPGESGYMQRGFSRPQADGIDSHVISYAFRRIGTEYQAELEEAYNWGGGHDMGGTIRSDIPQEWFSLSYNSFLEKVVSLSYASRYGFTADDLKQFDGLREFFGYHNK